MNKFLLGKKVRMTQIFDEDGAVIPVTVIQAGPVEITQVKNEKNDGYNAVQVAYNGKRREFKPEGEFEKGATIKVDVFEKGDKVLVSGIVKGRGFQGVVKRHNFAGASATHGTKHAHREPGSIGATWPQRVIKGTRMAGRMGGNRVSVKNLTVAHVDADKGLLFVRGAVPGARGALLEIVA